MKALHHPVRTVLLSTLLTIGAVGSALAQTQGPIERPQLQRGDTWVYRTVDIWTGNETERHRSVFGGEENQRLIFSSQTLPNGETSTTSANADLQACFSYQGSSEQVCSGALRFPMTPGMQHKIAAWPWRNGQGHFDADCEGLGMESVTVPAGTFEAFKVSCKGNWTRRFGGSSNGRYEETVWYVPAIKRHVRHDFFTWRSNGNPDTRRRIELAEFKVAP